MQTRIQALLGPVISTTLALMLALAAAPSVQAAALEMPAAERPHEDCNNQDGLQSGCWDGDRLCEVWIGFPFTTSFCLLYAL
jgi:hypothetical protein